MTRILFAFALGALALMAASIDGKWVGAVEQRGKRAGDATKAQITMDLRSEGSKLSGKVSAGRKGRAAEIQNGRIEGDKFSFETLQKNAKGEIKMVWSGASSGDELKGERLRDGRRRAMPFTAKREK